VAPGKVGGRWWWGGNEIKRRSPRSGNPTFAQFQSSEDFAEDRRIPREWVGNGVWGGGSRRGCPRHEIRIVISGAARENKGFIPQRNRDILPSSPRPFSSTLLYSSLPLTSSCARSAFTLSFIITKLEEQSCLYFSRKHAFSSRRVSEIFERKVGRSCAYPRIKCVS
jgi:hypothetical protein